MTIEKLPSGSYRVRQQLNGKRYALVFDHKPSNREIMQALSEKVADFEAQVAKEGQVGSYAIKYIDKLRQEGKSPATIRGYVSLAKNTPDWFSEIDLAELSNDDIQQFINSYKKNHSAKSVANMIGFYRAILSEYRPAFILKVKLPTKQKNFEYEPSTADIQAILEYAKNSRYYLFLRLAVLGLRRGEAACITSKDLNKANILTINKDMVLDENNGYVIKNTPKTAASNRRILIPKDVADLIRNQEVVFEGNLHTVNEYLHKVQDTLEIPRFRLHILRHFAAAFLLKNGFTTKQIEDYMGWEHGSSTMQKVYAYNLDPEESQKDIADIFNKL